MGPITRDCNPLRKNMIPTTSFPSLKALGRNYSKCDPVYTDFGLFCFSAWTLVEVAT